MKTIKTDNLKGFPTSLKTWDWLQSNTLELMQAVAKLAGNKTILCGCEVDVLAGTVTDGYIAVDGEVLRFVGGGYVNGVVIQTNIEQRNSVDENIPFDAYKEKTATCGLPSDFEFSDLQRISTLISIKTLLDNLIEAYSTHTHSYNDLNNLPAAKIVHKGSHALGDIGGSGPNATPSGIDSIYTINIPDQPNTNYMIIGTLRGLQSNLDLDNDVSWVVGEKEANKFKVAVRDYTAATAQNLVFDYIILY